MVAYDMYIRLHFMHFIDLIVRQLAGQRNVAIINLLYVNNMPTQVSKYSILSRIKIIYKKYWQ